MRFLLLFVFAATLLQAASAVLNCTAGALAANGIMLFDFRAASVEGWKIDKAALMLHLAEGAAPRTVRVSSVPRSWTEQDAASAASALFRRPARFGAYRATPAGQGWISVALDPALVEALASGRSFGLAIDPAGAKIDGARPIFTQPYLTAVSR
ncbi:MAG: hypothetical protein SFV51_11085 [Bryobacteraceae bacterium]|nr:hypothetical protein [Bryobacteraceae bacterium]